MLDLFLHGQKIESVFELIVDKENDITFSIGWILSNSPSFLEEILLNIFPDIPTKDLISEKTIFLQEHTRGGITDIEIQSENVYVIIEAKKGYDFPSKIQLKRYIP